MSKETVEQLKGLNTSRSTSSTNQNQEDSLKQQIKELQQETQHLKRNSNINGTNKNSSLKS